MRCLSLFTVLVALYGIENLYTQEMPAGMGIIVGVTGDVTVVQSGKAVPAQIGRMIVPDDSIALKPPATVTVLDANGSQQIFVKPFRAKEAIQAAGVASNFAAQLIEQHQQSRQWLAAAGKSLSNTIRSEMKATPIELIFPRNTKLLEPPTCLKWKSSDQAENYQVSIRCYENDFSFQETTEGGTFSLPDFGIDIEPNRQYYWYAQDPQEDIGKTPTPAWFMLLSQSDIDKYRYETQLLKSVLGPDTVQTAYRLLYVNVLIRFELYDLARQTIESVLADDPRNSTATMFYAMILDKMDLPLQSRKYVELTLKLEK